MEKEKQGPDPQRETAIKHTNERESSESILFERQYILSWRKLTPRVAFVQPDRN